jgi:hypothetical protein
MRIDLKIALTLGIAAPPAGLAVSEAIEYFPYLKAHPGLSFWASTLATLALFASAAALAVRGERHAEREVKWTPFLGPGVKLEDGRSV